MLDFFSDQLMSIISNCSNCNERSPEVISFVRSSKIQNGSKLDPTKSVLDPVWRTFEDFSGFDLHLRSIINVIPLVLCRRLWDKFKPDLCHFLILLYNFVYNVKAHINLTGKHTSRTLWFGQFSIFSTFVEVLMVFSHPDMPWSFKYLFFTS